MVMELRRGLKFELKFLFILSILIASAGWGLEIVKAFTKMETGVTIKSERSLGDKMGLDHKKQDQLGNQQLSSEESEPFSAAEKIPLVPEGEPVQIFAPAMSAVMSNGLLTIKINSKGDVYSLVKDKKELIGPGRFYLSYHVNKKFRELKPYSLKVVRNTDEIGEVVYYCNANELSFELHYVMLRGVSGLYCYIVTKNEKAPAELAELRIVMRVDPETFTYAYTAEREGPMVSPAELKQAPSIQDATYLLSDGTIYTKYDWASYEVEDKVHGLCGNNFGVWAISASNEYLNGGPLKQELMVHGTDTTPLLLKMFQGAHFGAGDLKLPVGWEKLYGPFFIYVNSGTNEEMIADANNKAEAERSLWPYCWMEHPLFPLKRGTVTGRLVLSDGKPAGEAMVVLAQPGEEIYRQGKEYMFWSPTAANGNFRIHYVRPGDYTLYAYATGDRITDQFQMDGINVKQDATLELGDLIWQPQEGSHFLWQIGKADRKSEEFKFGTSPRQYGLWEQVPDYLEYTIGKSKEAEDWYYAQTKMGTWKVKFNLEQAYTGEGLLTLAIAGVAREPRLQVYVNEKLIGGCSFDNDGTIYRSALRGGRYRLQQLRFPASLLQRGENTISLKLISVGGKGGIMYDTIKLEIE